MDTPIRVTRYFLRHWKYYIDNRNELSYPERKSARALFNGLKAMQESEVLLLHEKYCTGFKTLKSYAYKPITDKVIADRRGMSELTYRKQRASIEAKLHELVVKELERIEDEKETFHFI